MAEPSDELTGVGRKDTGAEALVGAIALRSVTYLIGSVGGRRVLDLACGDGGLSRWLAIHGAHVTGVDSSIEFVGAARRGEAREPHDISYLVADPEDLYMIDDSEFDDVVCNLSLGQMENLSGVVSEVARIIRLGGRFIFSVRHPCFELQLLRSGERAHADNYFAEGLRGGPDGSSIRHRTLGTYINAVAARGFTVRRLLEPPADKRDVLANPELEVWSRAPVALVIEAVFPKI